MKDHKRYKNCILPFIGMLISATVFCGQVNGAEIAGQYVELETANKQSFRVYVSGPKDAKKGILIIHGWLGLNKDVEDWVNHFAKSGFRAMAIDLYDNKIATNVKHAKRLMSSVKQAEANEKYAVALNALKVEGRKIATIGRSFGGSQALHATLSAPELVSATVSYYPFGDLVTDRKRLSLMMGPMLIQVGDEDFAFTPEKINLFKAAMQNANKVLELHLYNARHGFDKEKGKNFNKAARDKAWSSTRKFLSMHLE